MPYTGTSNVLFENLTDPPNRDQGLRNSSPSSRGITPTTLLT